MAALMATTYKAYLGVGLGPLSVGFLFSLTTNNKKQNELDVAVGMLCGYSQCLQTYLQFLTKFRIPHPGRVGGRFFIDLAMPLMLSWVLGGNR